MDKLNEQALCKLSDEEVAILAAHGNESAANHLIARYRNYVYKCASSYFVNGGEKEDIIQEGMIGLYKAIRDFNSELSCSFSVFAATCIKRQIISAVKASTRKKHLPLNSYISLSDKESEHESAAPEINEPLSVILDKEYRNRVSVKISKKLSKLELKVLYCYLEGMSYNDIASVIGKDTKSVDNAISRIKKKLLFLLCKDDE
ncbi:MAG: sigma-70 family RNA polymerase sigma factor [Eubacteriales bacterium]|nr:sigma-70 family RNA polymerase sigma factor [Eubacteriales bacterium]